MGAPEKHSKKTEKKIHKGGADLEALLEAIPHGVQEIDCEGTIIYANTTSHRIYGYAPGELIGSSIYGLSLTREDVDELKEYLAGLVREQPAPTPRIGRGRRKDGTDVDVRVDWNYSRDRAGAVKGFIAVVTDISAQREAEKSLCESEERFRSVVQAAPAGIHFYECRKDGRLIFTGANAAADTILGVDNSQYIGKTIEEAFPPLTETEIPGRYRKACLQGESWRSDQVVYEDLKITGAFEVNAFQVSPGRMAAMFTEITERKKAEEALRESEEKFRSIFDQAMDGILVSDVETKHFIDANSRICTMLRYGREELLRLGVGDIHPPGALPHVAEQFEKQIRGELPVAENLSILRKDGSVFKADVASAPLTLKGRLCLIGIFRDVTERMAAEREKTALQARNRQAQKMEALGTLAGGIAHDFNNILGAILGYADLARLKAGENSALLNDLEALLDAVDKARQLVRQILAFTRPKEENIRPLDLSEETMKALAVVRPTASAAIKIVERIEPGAFVIVADPAQIQQVLVNLMTNAIQAIEIRGEVEVGLEPSDPPEGEVKGERGANRFARFWVRDTGPGMTREVRERIFDPFFTTKEPGRGTGMGLSIVHRIVAIHDGIINVESEEGRGSLFSVYLPLAEAVNKKTVVKEGPAPGGAEHILYVDDEKSLAHVGKRLLEGLGYRVTAVHRGAEALELFRADPKNYDLIVTDQAMPGMTGTELAAQVLAERADMPIVLCTGFSSHVSPEKARAMGIRAFALKPLGRKQLADIVRRALDD